MKIYKNPIIGVILGIGFMVLGILQIAYPEYAGASTPRGVSFAKLPSDQQNLILTVTF